MLAMVATISKREPGLFDLRISVSGQERLCIPVDALPGVVTDLGTVALEKEVTIEGRDWIRAKYTLRAEELVLEANSEARIERAMVRVEAGITGVELIDQEQRPLDHLADDAPFDPRTLLGDQPGITPDLQAVLDQLTLPETDPRT